MNKVQTSSSRKTVETSFWSGICHLPNEFSNPTRKTANCQVKNFKCNGEKILLDLASNQLKRQHCLYLTVQVHYV